MLPETDSRLLISQTRHREPARRTANNRFHGSGILFCAFCPAKAAMAIAVSAASNRIRQRVAKGADWGATNMGLANPIIRAGKKW
jgi:hypothetical protein